jgi:small-conductance mechanosensitive channel
MISITEIFKDYPYLTPAVWIIVTAIVAIILERSITRYINRFAQKKDIALNVKNNMILFFRLIILVGVIASILRIGGLPTEWVLAFSAVGGTAVGFASTTTIGNLIAGLYVLITHPFKVGEYVRIGNIEGIVEEISITYTKIFTLQKTTVTLSNLKVLDQEIINYKISNAEGETYCYSFQLGFDHKLLTETLESLFDKVIKQYEMILPKKPTYALVRLTAFERTYIFYLFIEKPQDIFAIYPMFVRDLIEEIDEAKLKQQ